MTISNLTPTRLDFERRLRVIVAKIVGIPEGDSVPAEVRGRSAWLGSSRRHVIVGPMPGEDEKVVVRTGPDSVVDGEVVRAYGLEFQSVYMLTFWGDDAWADAAADRCWVGLRSESEQVQQLEDGDPTMRFTGASRRIMPILLPDSTQAERPVVIVRIGWSSQFQENFGSALSGDVTIYDDGGATVTVDA